MIAKLCARTLCAAAIVAFGLAHEARAQQPSAAAIALAKELIELKGATAVFDPVVVGVIEFNKQQLTSTNPNLAREINDIASQLRAELAPRRSEIHNDMTRIYASRFTEQELKDTLAFLKSPLGKKLSVEEPKVMEEATRRVDEWAAKFAQEVDQRIRAELKKKGLNAI